MTTIGLSGAKIITGGAVKRNFEGRLSTVAVLNDEMEKEVSDFYDRSGPQAMTVIMDSQREEGRYWKVTGIVMALIGKRLARLTSMLAGASITSLRSGDKRPQGRVMVAKRTGSTTAATGGIVVSAHRDFVSYKEMPIAVHRPLKTIYLDSQNLLTT